MLKSNRDKDWHHHTRYQKVFKSCKTHFVQKKLPKWLRNICLTKKCVFSDFENIAHCCYNGFEEDIYIYKYIYILYIYCIYIYIYKLSPLNTTRFCYHNRMLSPPSTKYWKCSWASQLTHYSHRSYKTTSCFMQNHIVNLEY